MKKNNLIEMLQGCSMRNGMPVSASNPDGGQTCDGNRQSRLMSYRCYLRNLAMIFAILTLSMANVGMAWGDVTLTVSKNSNDVYSETFADGSVLYSIDSNGRSDADNNTNNFKSADIVVDGSKKSGPALSDKRFAIKFPVAVSKVVIYGYNSSTRSLSKIYTSTTMGKSSYTDITSSTTKTSAYTTPNYNYAFTNTWASPIAANTAIWFEFNNSLNFYKIVYTPAAPRYKLSVFNSSTNGEYNFVAGTGENEIVINDFVIPAYTAEGDSRQFWVGPGSFMGQAANEYFSWKRAYHQQNNSCTSNLTLGNPVNAIGTLHAWTNSNQSNYGLCFEPNGYGIVWGVDGSSWTNVPFESTGEPTVWLTDIVSLTSDMISNYKYYVGLLTNDGGYAGSFRDQGNARGLSSTDNISAMRRKTASGDNWADGLVAGHGKFRIWVNNCTQNFYCHFVPHYKLTYDANGGSGAPEAAYVSVEETPCQWTLSNTQPRWEDHVFLGWSTNSSATKPDAASEIADLGTPYSANGDVTLYAVWQACSGPNAGSSAWTAAGYTYAQNATANEMSLTGVTASNGGALSYQWYKTTSDFAHGEAISGATSNTYRPATDVAHADNWFYFCRVTEAGCSTTYTTPLSGAIVVNAASLTALECNTLYTPADMLPSGKPISSGWQYDAYGLSGNTKFFIVGNGGNQSTAEADAGIVEIKTGSAVSISGTEYSNYCYFKKAPQMSGTTPTSKAIKFILSGSGSLDVYGKGELALVKEGGSPTTKNCTSTPSKVTWDNLTAGTYYLYATGTSRYILAMQLNCCTTPAVPTGFTAGSITSTGATFTITDAANATSYDIYYSTSNSAPDAGTAATTTSTEKTKAVTGLTASTTYYAWVRSVCDADHKSAWVALGTTSFTTAAAEPEALVHWTMNVATDGAWGTTATSTTDGTNISSISTSHDEGDNKGKSSATPKTAMADAEVTTAAEPTKSAKFTFTVKATKKVVPEKVTCEVFNVSTGNRTYKAQISDSNGHVYNSTNTVAVSTEATLTPATFTFASGLVLTGNVTVKVYAWKTSGSPTDFRMGQHVKLFGEVDNYICTALNLTRGGQESGTYTVGNYTGNPLTCTVNAGEPASYQWKQYTLGQGQGEAVNAEGSGSTTTSFTPNPASANTYFYACEVTDICGNTSITGYTGTFVFNAAPAFTASTSVNIEQFVLDNRKSKFAELQAALDAAHISYDLNAGCDLDSLDDACNKTDRNNDYLGLKIKAGAKYIQMNVPSGKTLKVRLGKRAAAVKVWIDEVAQTDIPTNGTYYTYELASSASNRVVKIATADGNAVVIKQIMIGEDIKTVTLPAKITLGSTTNGTISVASTKVNVGSTVTVTATPSSGYELATLTYTPACPAASEPVDIKTAKQFNMPNGNVTINATFTAAAPAGDCEELFAGSATSTSVFTTTVGSATTALSSGDSFSSGGYSYSVKPNSSNPNVASPKSGSSFVAGDSLIVVVYNNQSGAKTMGFKLGSGTYSTSVGSKKLHIFRQVLVASDISEEGKVTFTRQSADDRWVEIIIKHCGLLPSCTTPTIPSLSNQTVCAGSDIEAWDATQTAVLADGETVAYSWKKKGNDTELANTATLDLGSSATEAMAGTYVVTVTVSKADYASSMATKEVTLTVNEATEVTDIAADKATVYPTNSVTLTATANVTPNSWQWYTCTNAEGADEAIINDATSASYTITSAPENAGTYYYKVKATGSCGTAERVYTLTVSVASECEKYFWFVYADDATSNGVVNNRDGFFTGAPTGSSNLSTYKFTLDGTEYKATKNTGSDSFSMSFTIPKGSTATMGINCKGSSSKPLYLTHSSGTPQKLVSNSSSNGSFAVEDITEGTWTLTSAGSWTLAALGVQVCKTSTCTDATPTIAAANTTVCVGSELSITATGYESDPTSIQWQKLNSSTSTWDNISDASSATYTVVQATAADAGSYRVVVTKECARTSNTVTIAVPSVPAFADFTSSRTVMATQALSITDVEASDATSYAWYKSADATYDAGTDTKVGTSKELVLVSGGEAADATYYLFCVASNACGSTTSSAITVNVTAYVEEDCATKGNEGAADFGFTKESGVGESSVSSQSCWTSGGKAKYLTYTAPDGKYFDNAKVTVAVSSGSVAAYGYSTDGSSYTYANLTGLSSTLAEKTIDLPANVTHFRIGRNFDPNYGVTSGTFYLSKICFEYSNACTATTVTPSTSSVDYTMGGDWTNPKFTLSVAGTLTYSSSNEDIASVDENGIVSFNDKAGTVTITASYAGGTISETEYCASSGSYTITVSCPGGAPKIVAADGTNMSGCNSSVILNAKTQNDTDFADGTYQWFRNGKEISGATSSSYTATQTGVYTVEYTSAGRCTSLSTNNATVTSDNVEPEVERLVPFQYYHVNKNYSAQMKDRHLFSVKGSAANGSTGRNFKLTMSRSGGEAVDMTTAASIFVKKSGDGQVDTVMIDLNKLSGKYNAGDELVLTCAAVDCNGNASDVYKNTITIHVIGATPTLALICSGTDIAAGTRKTSELTVGGDFLTGYNKADLCQQTDNQTFDANTEWGLYTDLKANYIVTPVNGYAVFNKLNYEPFDILLLTDYPKASKSPAAATVLDDMADLCDYRPMLSFKTHMVAKSPSKWAAKGFTTSPVVTKEAGRLNLNIVCYAHPMFESLTTGKDVYKDNSDLSQLVYTMLSEPGYESSKGMQGFEIAAAENFVTIGLTHYNATIEKNAPKTGEVTWTPGAGDRMLVTVAERQTNIEARFILFSLNCGAQSKLTEKGEDVVLACLEYLLDDDPLHVADCALTFDNGAGNTKYGTEPYTGSGVKGDGKWSTEANWGPQYLNIPGEFNSARIAAPVTVDMEHAKAMELRIIDEGKIVIPAGKALEVKSTIRRMDGTEIYPTEISDIHIGSSETGNGTLIFDNNSGDTKARVDMYSTAKADMENMSAATSTWQYIGTPHTDVTNARSNYYGSWLYQYSGSGWDVIPNGGPLVPFRGYCITHPISPNVYEMTGTLAATTTQDIAIPAGYTVIANSWVAPIDISAITDDDMEGISDKTIYFFNTGTDAEGDNGTGTEAGTYVAVPKNSASYVGTWQIPSMQGFYISTTSAGTLHLDYDRHVRPAGDRTMVSNPMYAPRRAKATEEEPAVLKIFARGSRYQDKLVVLEREDFTRGYDSGWDGEAWGGGTLSPMVYVTGEGREDAVSAIPEFEGTVVAFKAGEDSEYRFEFIYSEDAEPLYLFDTENNTYTQIMTGNAYYFTTSDKAPHSRFILTRKAPQITTGTELTSDGESAKARKLLIEDKMYILLNGMLYDATGKVVK